jgi:hypothetical protein
MKEEVERRREEAFEIRVGPRFEVRKNKVNE